MQIKKAILTGGGRATRLRPITTTINKHLIPLANKPMIFHAIQKAVEAGVEEIFINTNPGETELQKIVGDGQRWEIKIKYFEQQGGPQGIAHVVNCAKKFIGNDPFLFYLSDNIVLGSLKPALEEFNKGEFDCMLAFSKVSDPERFGVPVFNEAKELIDVIEKPINPPNNFAVTGIYLYGPKVFFKAFKNIEKSDRGEYEISSIHSFFLKNNYKVGWKEITGWWKDTGKPNDLIMANKILLDQMNPVEFNIDSPTDGAELLGNVQIGKETVIKPGVKIIGPTLIGDNCVLENCVIGPYVTVGSGTTIRDAAIADTIIFSKCTIESPIKISDSILGEKAVVIKNSSNFHHLILGDHTLMEV